MHSINLLPQPVLVRRRVRRSLRAWMTFHGVYASAAISLAFFLINPFAAADRRYALPAAAAGRLDGVLSQIDAIQIRLGEALKQLRMVHAVVDPRDWSLLLEAFTSAVAEDVIIERLLITPAGPGNTRLVLDLDAVSPDQAGVSRLALQLEDLGIFERVELLESRRRKVGALDAVGCRLRCPFKEGL